MGLTPRRLHPNDPALADVLVLIQTCFGSMEGRIDPPSSMLQMTLASLDAQATTGEIWAIGTPTVACILLTPKTDVLYLGKLAVHPDARGQGYARTLITHAATRALAKGLHALELQSRVELTENHRLFEALGFTETDRSAHPGYDRPTSITFQKKLTTRP